MFITYQLHPSGPQVHHGHSLLCLGTLGKLGSKVPLLHILLGLLDSCSSSQVTNCAHTLPTAPICLPSAPRAHLGGLKSLNPHQKPTNPIKFQPFNLCLTNCAHLGPNCTRGTDCTVWAHLVKCWQSFSYPLTNHYCMYLVCSLWSPSWLWIYN